MMMYGCPSAFVHPVLESCLAVNLIGGTPLIADSSSGSGFEILGSASSSATSPSATLASP